MPRPGRGGWAWRWSVGSAEPCTCLVQPLLPAALAAAPHLEQKAGRRLRRCCLAEGLGRMPQAAAPLEQAPAPARGRLAAQAPAQGLLPQQGALAAAQAGVLALAAALAGVPRGRAPACAPARARAQALPAAARAGPRAGARPDGRAPGLGRGPALGLAATPPEASSGPQGWGQHWQAALPARPTRAPSAGWQAGAHWWPECLRWRTGWPGAARWQSWPAAQFREGPGEAYLRCAQGAVRCTAELRCCGSRRLDARKLRSCC